MTKEMTYQQKMKLLTLIFRFVISVICITLGAVFLALDVDQGNDGLVSLFTLMIGSPIVHWLS